MSDQAETLRAYVAQNPEVKQTPTEPDYRNHGRDFVEWACNQPDMTIGERRIARSAFLAGRGITS